MTMNGIMAIILRYFTEVGRFVLNYVTVAKGRLVLSANKIWQRGILFSARFTAILPVITEKQCVEDRCPHSKEKIRLVEHDADIPAIASSYVNVVMHGQKFQTSSTLKCNSLDVNSITSYIQHKTIQSEPHYFVHGSG